MAFTSFFANAWNNASNAAKEATSKIIKVSTDKINQVQKEYKKVKDYTGAKLKETFSFAKKIASDTKNFISTPCPYATNSIVLTNNRALNSPVGDAPIGDTFRLSRTVGSPVHLGTDYRVNTGTEVHATSNGTVVRAEFSSSYGNVVIIDHGNNVYSLYGHGSELMVENGDEVSTNQVIMLSGNTGHSTGPHLHYEVITSPDYGPSDREFYNNLEIRRSPEDLNELINQ
jgi:murein DD-endopeptidase MepM/ murein hydrolase activator NlpD